MIVLAGAVYADDSYTFELKEAYSFSEENENWSIKISLPEVSGMADEAEQIALNTYIMFKKDMMLEDYQENVVFAEQGKEQGYDPHFGYEYTWDVVTDSEDYFVFRISWFFAAGSSETRNEYFNLDKKTGRFLDFDEDAVTSPEKYSYVRDQIFAQMQAANEESRKEYGADTYWTEDDSLDVALRMTGYMNHWYYNQDGELVITFDKYDIAPGAIGCPEFIVSTDIPEA